MQCGLPSQTSTLKLLNVVCFWMHSFIFSLLSLHVYLISCLPMTKYSATWNIRHSLCDLSMFQIENLKMLIVHSTLWQLHYIVTSLGYYVMLQGKQSNTKGLGFFYFYFLYLLVSRLVFQICFWYTLNGYLKSTSDCPPAEKDLIISH